MKSLAFLFLVLLGMGKLWCLGSHGICREDRPHKTHHRVARQIAPAAPPGGFEREPAEGLPVPIYPGTRVTVAEIEPPHAPEPPQRFVGDVLKSRRLLAKNPDRANSLSMVESQTVTGRLSANETRARDDARLQLQHQVAAWLAPDVPATWKPPAPLLDRLIVRTEIEPIEKDYGTLYEATLHVDSAPPRRAEILAAYQHELVVRRMVLMGGGLAAILTGLAAVAGYIRADEATKGYYTNWLRVAAAAGVGASGVLIYQLLA
jgi:hypothetical protein